MVLPSVNESFGQVLVEAMACELPVIAVDRGGPAEIVDDGRPAGSSAPDDASDLEHAIVEAATDGAERLRRGRLARRDVLERYTWRVAARSLSEVLDDAAAERGSTRGEPLAA